MIIDILILFISKPKIMQFQLILLQLQQAIQHSLHPVWQNEYFYLFLSLILVIIIITTIMMKELKRKNNGIKTMQQQHSAKIDIIRKEHSDTLEKIRVEMLKREEERSRQWIESEKETLHVLNGVSTLLDLSEKIGRVESEKILKKLDEIQTKVEKITKIE